MKVVVIVLQTFAHSAGDLYAGWGIHEVKNGAASSLTRVSGQQEKAADKQVSFRAQIMHYITHTIKSIEIRLSINPSAEWDLF